MKRTKVAKFAQKFLVIFAIAGAVCGSSITANATTTSDVTEDVIVEETINETIEVTEASSGTWGNLEWSYASGVLTITGSGEMEGGHYWDFPWDDFNSSITKIVVGNGITNIPSSAFDQMNNLTTVTIGSGVTTIGSCAFEGCASLKAVTIPASVTRIYAYAFRNCKNLNTLTFASNSKLQEIGSEAFFNTAIKSLVLPDKLTNVGGSAFAACTKLEKVNLGAELTYITSWMFSGCTSLTEVITGSNFDAIDEFAFYECPITKFVTYSMNINIVANVFGNTSILTIYGLPNSTAQTYADTYDIAFKVINVQKRPTIQKIVNVVSGVHVYWSEVEDISSYTVYRSTSINGKYTRIKSAVTELHFIDTTAVSGTSYYYKISANKGSEEYDMSEAKGIIYVGTPDITSRINKGVGIQLGWNKIAGTTGYAIYRKPFEGTTWTRVATIKGNSTFTWTDESVKANNGTVYKYTIRALAGSDMKTLSGCRTTGRTMVRLASRTLSSATKASATSIKCNWTTSSAVTGYEVRFMVGDTVYKTYTIGNYKTGVKTFTGLKAGQTYKVQVRSYKKVSGVGGFYSAWSTPIYVKM